MLKRRVNKGLAAVVAVGALMSLSSQAQAGSYAFSTIQITGFEITDTGGTPLNTPTDLSIISTNTTQSSSATLNGVTTVGSPVLPPNGTIQSTCQGNCATVNGAPFSLVTPPLTVTSFSQAANQLTNAIITGTGFPAGANANSAAQTQLLGTNSSRANSEINLNAAFTFVLPGTGNKTIDIVFGALTQVLAALDPQGGTAQASSKYEISITLADGTFLFDWSPDGTTSLNSARNPTANAGVIDNGCVNLNNTRSEGIPGATNDSGVLSDPSCKAEVTLPEGVALNFTIDQVSSVNATSVPEPMSLALLATGLLGVGFFARRRRAP